MCVCVCVCVQRKLNTIGDKLNKVTTHQHFFKARESRHRHTVESSHVRVFWWSFLEISVIVTVGIVQVGGKQRFNGEWFRMYEGGREGGRGGEREERGREGGREGENTEGEGLKVSHSQWFNFPCLLLC